MIVLDTDHISVLRYPEHSQYPGLVERLAGSSDREFAMTSISVEEQLRGWLAAIRRAKYVHGQILYYVLWPPDFPGAFRQKLANPPIQ